MRAIIADPANRVEPSAESGPILAWAELSECPAIDVCALPRQRIVVESDGYDAHERTSGQCEHDRERRQWLKDHGWTVIVIRRGGFTEPELGRWIRRLQDALASPYTPVRKLERGRVRG